MAHSNDADRDRLFVGRVRNAAVRRVVAEVCPDQTRNVRVSYGRGTAHRWATVTTTRKLTADEQADIASRLLRDWLVGTYFADHGSAGDVETAQVSFRVMP